MSKMASLLSPFFAFAEKGSWKHRQINPFKILNDFYVKVGIWN